MHRAVFLENFGDSINGPCLQELYICERKYKP